MSNSPDTTNHNPEYRPLSEHGDVAAPKHRSYTDARDVMPNIMPEHIERIVITPRLMQVEDVKNGGLLKPVTILYREIVLTEEGHKYLQQGYEDLRAGKQDQYSIQAKQ